MRVLMLGPARDVHGGISEVVNNLFEVGLDKCADVTYIATMKEGSKFKKLLTALKAYREFSSKLADCDLVHVNMASDSSYLRKSIFVNKAASKGKKILIHQHGGDWQTYYSTLSTLGKKRVRKVFDKAEHILVLSPPFKEFLAETVGIDEEKISVFPNTIKMPDAEPKAFNQKRILFLGRICNEKGIRELFKATDDLHWEFPDMELVLGGIFEDEELRRMAEARGDYIRYVGWVTNDTKEKYLNDSEILVLPSYFEGQPMCVLEGMSYGCIVVATNVGGIPMMVENQKTGILIEPKDAEGLEDALRKVMNDMDEDIEKIKVLSGNAINEVKNRFNIENTVSELVKMYDKVSGNKVCEGKVREN